MVNEIDSLLGEYTEVDPKELDFETLFSFNSLNVIFHSHSRVKPNVYNPNIIADNERILLLQSLIEDGWTQPIVCRLPESDDIEALGEDTDYVIVDGEQRWGTAVYPITSEHLTEAVSGILDRKEAGVQISDSVLARLLYVQEQHKQALIEEREFCLLDLTGGKVPITVVNLYDDAHAMLSTLRHNRARGEFDPDRLATTLSKLTSLGLGSRDFSLRLGMSSEESGALLMSAAARARSLKELSASEEWSIDLGPLANDPDVLAYMEESTQVFDQIRLRKRTEAASENYAAQRVSAEHEEAPMSSEERKAMFTQYRGEYMAENMVIVKPYAAILGLSDYIVYDFYLTPEEYSFCMSVLNCFKGSLVEKLMEAAKYSDEKIMEVEV